MGEEKATAGPQRMKFYDASTGELLGRTAGSWAKIGLFYIAYFAFLAGLFTASIQIMKTSIDLEKPKLQTRLNIPGLHFFPKFNPMDDEHAARKKANQDIPFFWDSAVAEGDTSGTFYTTEVEKVKKEYAEKKGGQNGVVDFDFSTLGDCGKDNFGWDSNSPCVFFRLNRVIDWTPVGYFSPPANSFFSAEGNGLAAKMERDAVYIRCDGYYNGGEEDAPEQKTLSFNYYGGKQNDGYLESNYFPYGGKVKQPNYQSPIVAVKINGLTDGKKYKVKCHAFARNIVIDDRDNLGSISFEIQHGGEATTSV